VRKDSIHRPRGSSHRNGGLIRTAEVVRLRRTDSRTETVGFYARLRSGEAGRDGGYTPQPDGSEEVSCEENERGFEGARQEGPRAQGRR
jgi:hypothetical protein